MDMAMVGSVLRAILLAGGGVLVDEGLTTQSDLNSGVGCIIGLVGLGWSIWQKYQASKTLIAVANAPAPVKPVTTVAEAKATVS